MKRNIFRTLGIVALVAAIALAGCKSDSDDPDNGGETETAKKLTITGMDITGGVVILLCPNTSGAFDAGGFATISNGSATIELKSKNGNGYGPNNWTGSGEYYLAAFQSTDGSFSGNPFKVVMTEKFNFSSETTTVAWSKFQPYTE